MGSKKDQIWKVLLIKNGINTCLIRIKVFVSRLWTRSHQGFNQSAISKQLIERIPVGSDQSRGNNLTDYAWDGRDEFGDQLANGVYLYKVFMRKNGQNVELRPSAGDRGFKNGYGKLYLLR